MRIRLPHIILLAMGALLLASCHAYQYVPEGEHVLYKNVLEVTMADSSEVSAEVKDALQGVRNYYMQKPNSKVFGIDWLRLSMGIYGLASPDNTSFFGRYVRSLGQAPRVYSADTAARTADKLRLLMQSKGCFGSTVAFDTLRLTDHNITVGYHVCATTRYIIDDVAWHLVDRNRHPMQNEAVRRLLVDWREASPLRIGDPYDQDNIAAERSRLVSNLLEEGYLHATADAITFEVDTTYSSGRLSIDIYIDGSRLQVYRYNNIYIYPGGTAGLRQGDHGHYDTLIATYPTPRANVDFQFVYAEPMSLHTNTIISSIWLFPGMKYRPSRITSTYKSLLSLHNFRYINIDVVESPSSTDSLPLADAHVRLISATQQRLNLSLELTNASPLGSNDSGDFITGGNLGFETSLEYQHKNLFGGAELLKIKGSLLFELPKFFFSSGSGNFSAFEAGVDASLDMPQFMLPFLPQLVWQRTRPHTLFNLGGSYQHRYYFKRILANISYGYTWNPSNVAHQVLPIELTFVRMLSLDEDFAARLRSVSDLRMKYQYSSHFIMAARYDVATTTQRYGSRINFSALHASVESAGNLLSLASHVVSMPADSNGILQPFGVPFSQYVRLTGEWSRYHYIGRRSTFVSRLLVGIGLPYGNSMAMPYEKSFFGGGPTTLRAWHLRRLGPGGYNPGGDILERVGDLQLVLNLEGRFPIVSIIEGALFADLGNVWLLNASDQYPDGQIKWNSIPKEIAVGIGFGLRFNVSIATLRLDFAIPLYDPSYTASLRWRPPEWQWNQIVTNFGINYPF